LLSEYPYIAHLFLYSPEKGLLVRSQPKRLSDPGFEDEINDVTPTIPIFVGSYPSVVEDLTHMTSRGMYFLPKTNWTVRGNQKMIYQPMSMFLIKDKKTGATAIAGM